MPLSTTGGRNRALRRVSVVAGLLCLLLAASAWAAVGGLTQKAGTAGCISETGAGPCADGVGLDSAFAMTVSPDGKNAYVASFNSSAVLILDRNTVTGELTQKAGTAGCISESGSAGACVDGTALLSANAVTVSPDGKSVYVGSRNGDAVAIFDRDSSTGALTQKAGTAGCISDDGTGGLCTDGTALETVLSIAVSADGANVYVSSGAAVAIFDRTATGVLVQKAGTAGCISQNGGPCVDGDALSNVGGLSISPDGANVYAASFTSKAVLTFDRNPSTGALTQKAGTAGCIQETGASPCGDGVALQGPASTAISPDGTSIYVASGSTSNAVAVFDRNPSTGVLTQKAGTAGCISETGAGPCTDGVALDSPQSVVAFPEGTGVYVISSVSDAAAIFDRDTTTGALTQRPGVAGCISNDGTAGACADGTGMDGATGVAISPGGSNVYVAAQISDAVAVLDRDVAPETTIDSGPSGVTNDNTPTFGFSSNEAGSTFECSLDAGAFSACSGAGATHTTAVLADGAHTFQVRAVDPTANPDPTPASRAFTVETATSPGTDTTPPDTAIDKAPKTKVKTKKKKAKVSVSFSSEAGASFECRLDDSDFDPCSSPFTVKAKSKGGKGKSHTIEIRAIDQAGNVEQDAASVDFKLIRKD
jgi:DNA-binding beta-propeller fold protein YncE